MIEISQYSKEIALALLGEENKRLSSAYELRYGNKGSLSVDLNKGTWFDHEADEGGGMISFIKKYHGEDVSQFLRSMGIEDLQPVSVTAQPEKPTKIYSNDEMRNMAKKAELVSRYSDTFCVMRFPGKVIRPFSRLDDGTWQMKRPKGQLPLLISSEGDESLPCLIVEGEQAALGARALYEGIVVTWHGGTGSWNNQDWSQLKRFPKAIIWPDNDEAGFEVAKSIKDELRTHGIDTVIIEPPEHFQPKDDLMDAFEREEPINVIELADAREYEAGKRVIYSHYGDFKDKEYPQMVWVIENLMARGHLSMIHGSPGHGKSLITQIMAVCLAAGYDFGHYRIEKPQKVLLVDAEMPPVSLQERFADMMIIFNGEVERDELIKRVNQNLVIVSHHDQPEGLIPLNTDDGREWYYNLIDDVDPDFIILDNLLTLMQFEDSNSSEEWVREVNPLLLKMRQQDRSVWFVHHSGKSGKQLGSMAKEVILDCVVRIELQGIDEEDDDSMLGLDTNLQESKFKWTFEKTRHFYGQHAFPVLWKYSNGILTKDLTDKEMRTQMVAKMKIEGLSNKEIAKEFKINERTVRRDLKSAESLGFIDNEPEF
jgi:DNA-binding NarL/FixJ family response regulator